MSVIERVVTEVCRTAGTEVEEYERTQRFPHELVRQLCEAGLTRLALGIGAPADLRRFCANIEVLARTWVALAESVHLQTLALVGITAFGSAELRAELTEPMAAARTLGGNCFSEPDAGSDLSAIETSAEPDGTGYRINGRKSWVGHAAVAGILNVYARTGASALGGITCFAVDRDSAGVHVHEKLDKFGARSLPTSDVTFDDVWVPRGRVVGRPNRGMVVAHRTFVHGRLGIAACAIGLAQAALDRAVAYAKGRRQFGGPVFDFQGVQFPMADTATRVQASRQLLYHACAEVAARGPMSETLAAQAKLLATETAMTAAIDTAQVIGAYGYGAGSDVARWIAEAKLLQIIEGTSQMQRVVIANAL